MDAIDDDLHHERQALALAEARVVDDGFGGAKLVVDVANHRQGEPAREAKCCRGADARALGERWLVHGGHRRRECLEAASLPH